jgi:uncharacterized membrane protein YjjB (DUF3815 family)
MLTPCFQIIAGCVGTFGFGVLFNIRGKKLLFGAMGGFLAWTLYVLFSLFIKNEPMVYMLVSIFTSIYMKLLIAIAVIALIVFIILCIRLNIARLKKRRVRYIPYGKKEKHTHEK